MHFSAFNRCPASLLHAGWLHQSWFCWNQPEETQRKERDEYREEREYEREKEYREERQCFVGTSIILARSWKNEA